MAYAVWWLKLGKIRDGSETYKGILKNNMSVENKEKVNEQEKRPKRKTTGKTTEENYPKYADKGWNIREM